MALVLLILVLAATSAGVFGTVSALRRDGYRAVPFDPTRQR